MLIDPCDYSLIPANMIASFVKRLARLSLSAAPAAIIMLIPFIYNLLKKHPSCMSMLHRVPTNTTPSIFTSELDSTLNTDTDTGTHNPDEETDPFDPSETNPMQTRAIESSLWELQGLQRHYLSHVATMGKLFGETFTRGEFNLDDFTDYGYGAVSVFMNGSIDI